MDLLNALEKAMELSAFTIGGTAEAINAELVRNEFLGSGEGVSGQRLELKNKPVVAGEAPLVVEINESGDDWTEWTERSNFATSGPDDRHFVLDAMRGEIEFGPSVRLPDGSMRNYGMLKRACRSSSPSSSSRTSCRYVRITSW